MITQTTGTSWREAIACIDLLSSCLAVVSVEDTGISRPDVAMPHNRKKDKLKALHVIFGAFKWTSLRS